MHKNDGDPVGIVRLKEIQPRLVRVMTGPKRCHQLLREKIGWRAIIRDRRGIVSRQWPNFSLYLRRRLLRRTSQSKSSFRSSKIERGCHGCSYPLEWRKIFARTNCPHSGECAADAVLPVDLLDPFSFNLIRKLEGGEIVGCPDAVAGRLKMQMIGLASVM